MNEDDNQELTKAYEDVILIREKVTDFTLNSRFQLLLSQLDLFKGLASLTIGILGIGYLLKEDLDSKFVLLCLIFALLTLVISVSYSRQTIDAHTNEIENTKNHFIQKTKELIVKMKESKNEHDIKIFRDARTNYLENYKPYEEPPQSNYTGETLILFFFLSIGYLVLAYISSNYYQIKLLSIPHLLLLLIIWLVSFVDWAGFLMKRLSKRITFKTR